MMKRLELLDLTRLLAAIMVVFFHWTFNGINNGKISSIEHPPALSHITQYGYWGVTLFFLISGFVISYSIQGKSARQYVTARLTRLYPAFWVCLMLTTTVALILRPGRGMNVESPLQFLANLTMVPNLLGQNYVDGVYWTLGFELFFYLIILLIMLFGLQKHLRAIMIGWAFLCLMTEFSPHIFQQQDFFITSRPFPAFIGGALIASYVWEKRSFLTLGAIACTWICTVRSEVKYSKMLESVHQRDYSLLLVALLITGFFALLLIQASSKIRSVTIPYSQLAGDLTYPLYLLHAHLGYMAISLWATNAPSNLWILLPALLAFFLLLSYLVNRYVEKKLRKFWLAFFNRTAGTATEFLDRVLIKLLPYRNRPRAQGA